MKKKLPFGVTLMGLLVISAGAPALTPMTPPENQREVTQVLSGDTLVLKGGEVVRLIGVEAPQKPKQDKAGSAAQSWFERSREFTAGLVQGRKVWLKYGEVKTDAQGRTWAFVYFDLKQGGTLGGGGQKFAATPGIYMVNEQVLRYGMATSGNPFPFALRTQFKQLENDARQMQTGLFQSNF